MLNSLLLLHFKAHFFKDGTVLLSTSENSDPMRNKPLHEGGDRHCLKHGTESYPSCDKESHKLTAEISKDPVAFIKINDNGCSLVVNQQGCYKSIFKRP